MSNKTFKIKLWSSTMKANLLKLSILAASMAFTSTYALAEDAPKEEAKAVKEEAKAEKPLDNKEVGYALGTSLATYVDSTIKQQQELGSDIKKEDLLAGLQETLEGKGKMTEGEANLLLQRFSEELQKKAQEKAKKESEEIIAKGTEYREKFAAEKGVEKTESGLLYRIDTEGEGTPPTATDSVKVHYRGTLVDGTEFDSSYSRNEPITFRLDSVIKGWTEGLQKMKPGSKATLVIPPELGYGEQAIPSIPANSTLIFEVELLEVNPKADAAAK